MEGLNISTQQNNNYINLEKAGIRDWILNNFYDLSIYDTNLCKKLSGIKIYHNEEYIYGLEFFYDNLSTGLYKGKEKINDKINSTLIEIKEDEYVQSVIGSYSVDYITQLVFCLNSGVKNGFTNQLVSSRTDLKFFKFEKEEHQIFCFKFAFGSYLTFISPIFKEIKKGLIYLENSESNFLDKHFSTKKLGKSFDDSISFKYENQFNLFGKISSISLYHDDSLVKGIVLNYGNKKEVRYYHNIKDKNIKCETLNLDLTKNEEIIKIFIRSGDMIDNITIYTNKGNSISAGGHGGGPIIFNIEEIRKELNNEKLQFCGFSGGYMNNFHYIEIKINEI